MNRPGPARFLAVVAFLFAMPLTSSASKAQSSTLHWILSGPSVAVFASDSFAQQYFAGTQPFVVQRAGDPVTLPPAWNAYTTRTFTSYSTLVRAFNQGKIGPDVKAILYDSEAWSFTPPEEQRNFGTYAKMVADLVHGHGLQVIMAPAVDLVRNLAPPSEPRYEAYLRLRLAAEAARYADVYEIQSQGSEKALPKFTQFVLAAAQQARAANPNVRVYAGLSTNPSGQSVTAQAIVRAVDATRSGVDGYWFNVPAPSDYCPQCNAFLPELAIEVLRQL